mmetsp:Transcript_110021/g.200241  ORF Transcript_110021/g.200241 Transcript_110021/m.200241 type:complete len:84 (-) Transcript_110021:47-298(-)
MAGAWTQLHRLFESGQLYERRSLVSVLDFFVFSNRLSIVKFFESLANTEPWCSSEVLTCTHRPVLMQIKQAHTKAIMRTGPNI